MKLSISRQLLIGVVLSSTMITILVTAFNLYQNYQDEVKTSYIQFDALVQANTKSLETSLWDLNFNQIKSTLDGIISFKEIDALELKYESSEGLTNESLGNIPQDHLFKSYDLNYEKRFLGTLKVYKNKKIIYESVFDKLIILIVLNTIKTFLASFLILIVINSLLTNHLVNISLQLKKLDFKNLKPISIKRLFNNVTDNDELSYLVKTINKLFHSINERSENLEKLVEQRTLELNEAKNSAEDASRYKSIFFTKLSHEIRTPLGAIIASSELLKKEVNPINQKPLIDSINLCGEGLLKILDNSIELSKLESGNISVKDEEFNLSNMLKEVSNIYEEQAKIKNIHFHLDVPPTLTKNVIGDPTKISQVLHHLLNNSFKFTPERGTIKLRIQESNVDEKYNKFKFSVEDSGIGVSSEQLKNIFKNYTQEDENIFKQFGGTGLGLPISRYLCELMGGSLLVSSTKNEITIFEFNVALERVITSKVVTTKSNKIPLGDFSYLKVLIVEDYHINRKILHTFLNKFQIKADEAENGSIAVDMMQKNNYDLILMDLHMPVMDGHAATSKIRSLDLPSQPVIFALTANAVEEEREKALKAGMDDFYVKPISVKKLQAILTRFTEKKTPKAS